MTDAEKDELIDQLAKALEVEVENCELGGDKSTHHDWCRSLIEKAWAGLSHDS